MYLTCTSDDLEHDYLIPLYVNWEELLPKRPHTITQIDSIGCFINVNTTVSRLLPAATALCLTGVGQ